MLIDKFGLFDYNSQLTYDPNTYNNDVKVLQNELAWNGYLTDGDIDGYFGGKTLTAVNQYKNDKGLWNFGEYEGVVGLTTWKSLGLIYRSQNDIDEGVYIMTTGCKQYFDISEAVQRAVDNAVPEFQNHAWDFEWFANTVGNDGIWNIKRGGEAWATSIGTTFPGVNSKVVFLGRIVTVEDIGNITFGYLGSAASFPETILIAGSVGNHFATHFNSGWSNEFSDHNMIKLGIDWYDGYDITVRWGTG